jgi:hypothetical protein
LEQVQGVKKVLDRSVAGDRYLFEVESLPGHNARGDLARAVVHAGWNLLELKSPYTLEEVYLALTGADVEESAAVPAGGVQ